MDAPDDSSDRWLVACLCADWCHVCQDYRQTFAQLAREFAGAAGFVWVDIEEDEDALGTVEVDDFPTLLIARAGQICHFAVVMPSAPTGQRRADPAFTPVRRSALHDDGRPSARQQGRAGMVVGQSVDPAQHERRAQQRGDRTDDAGRGRRRVVLAVHGRAPRRGAHTVPAEPRGRP
jgi:thiol-disulfide isomerase/thioredoxin